MLAPSVFFFARAETASRAIDEAVSKPIPKYPKMLIVELTSVLIIPLSSERTESKENTNGIHLPRSINKPNDRPENLHHDGITMTVFVVFSFLVVELRWVFSPC